MTLTKLRAACALIVLAAVSACGFLQRQAFAQPEVYLVQGRLTGLNPTGGRVELELNVFNPNGFRLDASNLRYKAYLDTMLFAEGMRPDRVTVNPKDSVTIRFPVDIPFAKAFAALSMFSKKASLEFRLEGDVKVETSVANSTRAFNERGTIEWPSMNITIFSHKKR